MRTGFLIVCLLLTTACDEKSPAGPTIPLAQRFTLAPGESATIDEAGFSIEFRSVSGDSRCPADAVCIQGGDASVHVRVTDATRTDYELHTGDSSRAAVTHRQARIELVELQPYPFSSRPIAPGDYRVTLTVTRP